jgi:hypothetical protein
MMDKALAMVTDWLLCASSLVDHEFIQLPVAGAEESEYRERVYCYELYHQWRCHWSKDFPFSLSGEVDKAGHPLIRKSPKPDFLVHIPGQMTNLLIVEVKPKNADGKKMVEDLMKLTRFRRDLRDRYKNPANYYEAYFWVYGLPIAEWPELRSEIRKASEGKDLDYSLMKCFVHEQAGTKASQVTW